MWFIIIIVITIIIIPICSKPNLTEERCNVSVLCCIMRCILNSLFNLGCLSRPATLIAPSDNLILTKAWDKDVGVSCNVSLLQATG